MGQPVQSVITTIRDGIRKYHESNSHGELNLSQDVRLGLDFAEATQRISQQIAHFRKLMAAWKKADAELADAIDHMGECPPGPSTLRALLGRLIIKFLNRIFWWKTEENRRLGALVLGVARVQADQLEALARALEEHCRISWDIKDPVPALLSLRSQIAAYQTDLDRRIREIEAVLLDLQSWRTEVGSLDGSDEFLRGAKDLSRRILESEQAIQRLEQEKNSAQSFRTDSAARADRAQIRLDSVEEGMARLLAIQQELVEFRAKQSSQGQALEDQISKIGSRLGDLGFQTQRVRTDVSLQDRRLSMFLAEARKRLPEPFDQEQIHTLVSGEQDKIASLYLAFENVYRGTRSEIKERQSVYLPLLRNAAKGKSSMPVLDLGCGRGEWLELLKDEGWDARGVDANELMLEECLARGLKVERGDVLGYLQQVPEATLGAITSFHVVEHLPFERVILLIDEALRALRPNGILILETPNPDNLLVGASTFYLDPTHIRPIPSGTLRFVVEARGFCDAEVWNLHPMPESARLPEDTGGVAGRLNELLCGPRDYAVIGRRP